MKKKFIFVGKMLVVAWVLQLILFTTGGNYAPGRLWVTLLVMGPVAGSSILAVIVSEISEKRRVKKDEKEF